MNLFNVFLVVAELFFLCYGVQAASCINLSLGGTEVINTYQYVPTDINLRVYNVSPTEFCDSAVYSVEILFKDRNIDYNLSINDVNLINGENQRIILTILPTEVGSYDVIVKAFRSPNDGQQKLILTTESSFRVNVAQRYSYYTAEVEPTGINLVGIIEDNLLYIFIGILIAGIFIIYIRKNKSSESEQKGL